MTRKKKVIEIILNIVLGIMIVLCSVSLIFRLTHLKVVVSGSSMNPSIVDGSKGYMVKVNKHSKIERFDVVTAEYNSTNEYYIIKRVLGLPGEEVKLLDNELTINDEVVEQPFEFIKNPTNFPTTYWTLGDDEYLIVGDNRAGTIAPKVVTKDNIIAKNGFSYALYDMSNEKCVSGNYSSCPIIERKFYWFRGIK